MSGGTGHDGTGTGPGGPTGHTDTGAPGLAAAPMPAPMVGGTGHDAGPPGPPRPDYLLEETELFADEEWVTRPVVGT
ncbi:MAG TPA: hypothetical protein VGH99_03360 [Pseudonocardia sp.]|jgi:hypothetical protein